VKKTDGNFGNENSFHSFVPRNRSMETKERIMLKAQELFMQFGIRSVSMDDIANSLGMSKKTVYQYYADKDELVEAVVERHISEVQGECISCRENAKDAIHEINLTMEHIMEELGSMNPMLLYDLEKFHYRSYKRFRDYKDKFLAEMIRRNIEWGIKEELYRAEVNIEKYNEQRQKKQQYEDAKK